MLRLEEFAEAKGFTVEQLAAFGVRQNGRGIEIPYFTADGAEYPRVRIRTAIAAKDGSEWSRGSADLIPYGIHRPIAWDKRYAFIVEGESDCWTLWLAGKPAIGIPGATNLKCLRLEILDGADTLYVIREPDEAGSNFPHRVAQKVYDMGFAGAVYAVALADAKDPHDLWKRDPSVFEEQLRAAVAARELVPRPQKAKPRTAVRSFRDILAAPRKKPEWLIDEMLPAAGIMLIAAKPKAGKSVLARNIARAIATGGEFLGRSCRQGKVVWLRLEEQYTYFVDDMVAMGAADWADNFITNEEIPKTDLFTWLENIVKEHEPVLVVIDTWAKLTRVNDIGNYAEVNRANEALMRLRENGVAQIWIHHAKKGEASGHDDVLGSQALFAACDTLAFYRRSMTDDARTFSTTQRVGDDVEDTIVDLDPVTKLVTRSLTRTDARLDIVMSEILMYLGSRPGGTAKKNEVATEIKRRRSDIFAACDILEERRLVRVERLGLLESHTISLIVGGSAGKESPSAIRFSEFDTDTAGTATTTGSNGCNLESGSGKIPDQFRALLIPASDRSSDANPRGFPGDRNRIDHHPVGLSITRRSRESLSFPKFPYNCNLLSNRSAYSEHTPYGSDPTGSYHSYTVASIRLSYTSSKVRNTKLRQTDRDATVGGSATRSRCVRAERERVLSPRVGSASRSRSFDVGGSVRGTSARGSRGAG